MDGHWKPLPTLYTRQISLSEDKQLQQINVLVGRTHVGLKNGEQRYANFSCCYNCIILR
jgi:hypothetical protein